MGAFVSTGAVGVFMVARQLQNLPEQFNQMLLMVGAPMFSAAHGRKNSAERQHIYHLMTDWTVRSSLPLVLFLFLFGRDVLGLYGPEFADKGTVPLWILVGAQFFSLLCGPTGNLAIMSGLEWQSLRFDVTFTMFLIAALVVLTPLFGLIGVVLAYSLTVVFQNVMMMILVRRKLSMRWWDRRYLEWLPQCGAAIAVAAIALSLPAPFNAVEVVATCFMAMYAAAIGVNFLRGLHADDKELIRYVRQAVRVRLRPLTNRPVISLMKETLSFLPASEI